LLASASLSLALLLSSLASTTARTRVRPPYFRCMCVAAHTCIIGAKAETLAPLIIGLMLIVACGVWEAFTKRVPIIPPRLFKTRTTGILLVSVFLHAFIFFAGAYYLPIYFQVLGSSALLAGVRYVSLHASSSKCLHLCVRMIPYSFASSITSVIGGLLIAKTGRYRVIIWVAWAIMVLGYGLLTMLNERSSVYVYCYMRLVPLR
jgi:hypothetical protein